MLKRRLLIIIRAIERQRHWKEGEYTVCFLWGLYLLIKELFVVWSQDRYTIKLCTGRLCLYLVQSSVIVNQCITHCRSSPSMGEPSNIRAMFEDYIPCLKTSLQEGWMLTAKDFIFTGRSVNKWYEVDSSCMQKKKLGIPLKKADCDKDNFFSWLPLINTFTLNAFLSFEINWKTSSSLASLLCIYV